MFSNTGGWTKVLVAVVEVTAQVSLEERLAVGVQSAASLRRQSLQDPPQHSNTDPSLSPERSQPVTQHGAGVPGLAISANAGLLCGYPLHAVGLPRLSQSCSRRLFPPSSPLPCLHRGRIGTVLSWLPLLTPASSLLCLSQEFPQQTSCTSNSFLVSASGRT